MHTESTEMYLITVYRLTRLAPRASTKDIATLLKISQPSVSEQLKRLTQQGYLNYQWREGATLTGRGERSSPEYLGDTFRAIPTTRPSTPKPPAPTPPLWFGAGAPDIGNPRF